jgi:Uma2 family endonuclease
MNTDDKLITAAEFFEMTLEGNFELVRGELIEMPRPSHWHGVVCGNILLILKLWAREHHLGFVSSNDSGVVTEHDPDSVRSPDCSFISRERLPQGPVRGWLEVPPELAVEVLSPNDRWRDVLDKVGEYLQAGVLEVWVADPEERRVHVYRQDQAPFILDEPAELTSPTLPEFRCVVADFFTEE